MSVGALWFDADSLLTAVLCSRQGESPASARLRANQVGHRVAREGVTWKLTSSRVVVEASLVSDRFTSGNRGSTGSAVESNDPALCVTAVIGGVTAARTEGKEVSLGRDLELTFAYVEQSAMAWIAPTCEGPVAQ